MKNIILAASAFLISQFSFAQSKDVTAFTALKVFDKIPVQLVSSDSYRVEVSGNMADDVEFVNSGNELRIRMKPTKLLQGDDIKILLYYKDISDIQASQGAKITSDNEVKSAKLGLTSNEGSLINLNVNASVVEGKVNTGGLLQLSGSSDSQSVVVNTGGKYDGKNLSTKITSITTNAGGQASVNATESVDATTRAGGVIDVYGKPKSKNDKKIAGGKINYR
ncbi:head GIN domain-containing protein [Epilithonimonas sp. UC225_85]|uniref:head GIN domain-containing protein n=1 Tax=Epilithonimonas sp. UC225_85 TaxID=3350167 RepID=UPI0036D2D298